MSDDAPAVAVVPLYPVRENAYLLTALCCTGSVGVRARDVENARLMLPIDLFKDRVRLARGSNVTVIGDSNRLRRITVDAGYYSTADDHLSFRLPYFAHPIYYSSGQFRRVRGLRVPGLRARRIFFAGTVESTAYSKEFRFPIMRRDQIFEIIHSAFEPKISDNLDAEADLTIIITRQTDDNINKYQLDHENYISTLAQSNFFICPPGWRVPHCHNMVEAMSLGVIPITNYADFCYPPLVDGVNCMAFNDKHTLVSAIERAIRMTREELLAIRASVVDYYDRYLDPFVIGRELRERLCIVRRIIVNNETGR